MNGKEHPELVDYVLGTLDGDGKRRVERHLAGCETCRNELAHWQTFEKLLARWPDDQPSEADSLRLAGRVAVALRLNEPGSTGRAPLPGSRRPHHSSREGWLFLLAAAALALLMSIFLWVAVFSPTFHPVEMAYFEHPAVWIGVFLVACTTVLVPLLAWKPNANRK
jgi:anti-sigma factor RsiW